MTSTSSRASFRAARDLTRHHARSFYFASHLLPPSRRPAAYALYAFCRWIDDQVDLAPTPEKILPLIESLRITIDTHLIPTSSKIEPLQPSPTPTPIHEPWWPAFTEITHHYRIPLTLYHDLLTGVAIDSGPVRLKTWEELDHYCYHVASVVGLMMLPTFTQPREELRQHAIQLGAAMQITNILRDISEDLDRDRIYLPEEALNLYGVTESMLRQKRLTSSLRLLLKHTIARARALYKASEAGIRQLPNDGTRTCVWLMRTLYAAILDEIIALDYDIFRTRAHTSLFKKMHLLIRARFFLA